MSTTEETAPKQIRPPVVTKETQEVNYMANDANFAATPYPTYNLGGDNEAVQSGLLVSHSAASVERNQDAQFDAGRTQFVHRDVVGVAKDSQLTTLETKFDLAVHAKDAERRHSRDLAEIKAMIQGQQIAVLTKDLSEAKADARNGLLEAALNKILAKLP